MRKRSTRSPNFPLQYCNDEWRCSLVFVRRKTVDHYCEWFQNLWGTVQYSAEISFAWEGWNGWQSTQATRPTTTGQRLSGESLRASSSRQTSAFGNSRSKSWKEVWLDDTPALTDTY